MGTELGEGLVIRTTEGAVLVQVEGEEIWIPRSILHAEESEIDEDSEEGDEGTVVVKTWWAEKEGWA